METNDKSILFPNLHKSSKNPNACPKRSANTKPAVAKYKRSIIGTKIFQNLTVSLIGRNLFYIYKSIPNIDPESSIGTNRETAAQEYGAYPSTRSYGFSIRASF